MSLFLSICTAQVTYGAAAPSQESSGSESNAVDHLQTMRSNINPPHIAQTLKGRGVGSATGYIEMPFTPVARRKLYHKEIDINVRGGGDLLLSYNRQAQGFLENTCGLTPGYTFYTFTDFSPEEIFNGTLPEAIDLRTEGLINFANDQGTCGSCYAESTLYVLENLVYHDLYYYTKIYENTSFAAKTNKQLRFSVEYLLHKTYSSMYNEFCAGGNFRAVIEDVANFRIDSLQYKEDYPYYSMFHSDDAIDNIVLPVLKGKNSDFVSKELLNPLHLYTEENNCPVVTYHIDLSTDTGKTQLKSFLARGIAVSGHMFVDGSLDFEMYKSGVFGLEKPCMTRSSNHEVTFIGYGTFKGKKVFLIQNSWSQIWGNDGSFMVEEGSNAFCTEMDADAVLPRFWEYDLSLDNNTVQFNQSELYRNAVDQKLLVGIYSSIHWGKNGLDRYENGKIVYEKAHFSKEIIIALSIAGLLFLTLIASSFTGFCCRKQNIYPPAEYYEIGRDIGASIPWGRGSVGSYTNDFELGIAE